VIWLSVSESAPEKSHQEKSQDDAEQKCDHIVLPSPARCAQYLSNKRSRKKTERKKALMVVARSEAASYRMNLML
jgi:hypothetical protein